MDAIENGFHSRGRSVFVVTTATFIPATIFVAARLISRFGIVRHRTADDWCMILAWFIAFGLSFSIDYGTTKGLGRRDVDIPQEWLQKLHQSEYVFTILYNPALMASKTSILIFYLRIARDTQKLLRIASYVTLAIINVAGIIMTFLSAFQCSPVSAAYSSDNTGQCMSIVTLYLCQAPVNIITDLAILILPIPVLTGMRLPQRQKSILIFTFTLGIFVTVVDVVRIYYLQQASDDQSLTHSRIGTGVDFSYNASTALMWSAVEVNVGIICACIPTLKPLINRILPSMLIDRHKSGPDKERTTFMESQAAPGMNGRPHELSSFSSRAPRIQPLPHHQQGVHLEDAMNMMSFLTATGTDIDVGHSQASRHTEATAQSVYFGFIDMNRPRSMLRARGKEAFIYCTAVTIIFFLWGFSYGLLNSLNIQISMVAHQSTAQTVGLTTAYFGAYFFGPLTLGQWVLRHGGFKATFICGLCIYGTGTLMFWPSAVLRSFPGFIICNFVVGYGLSILETAANPFLALCGPSKYAEYRLLLAQAVQGVGSILSQLLAQRALFKSIVHDPTLIDVQWTYLAIALFTVLLALFFYYMPLPEATDIDLQLQSDDIGVYPNTPSILGPHIPLIYLTLSLAVFSQFLYVAAQQSMSTWFTSLLTKVSASTSTPLAISLGNYTTLSLTMFAISRFLFAALCLVIPPRILLLITFIGGVISAALTMSLQVNINGIAAPALMFFFFEGPAWPLIYAIGLRGMGKRTKIAAACLTAGASGGSGFPFVQYAIVASARRSTQYSFCLLVALFSCGAAFPLYLNLVPGARHQVDPIEHSTLGEEGHLRHGRGAANQRPISLSHRMSKSFKAMVSQASVTRSSAGRKISQEAPVVSHNRDDSRTEGRNSSFLSDGGMG